MVSVLLFIIMFVLKAIKNVKLNFLLNCYLMLKVNFKLNWSCWKISSDIKSVFILFNLTVWKLFLLIVVGKHLTGGNWFCSCHLLILTNLINFLLSFLHHLKMHQRVTMDSSYNCVCLMVFNAAFNNISVLLWRSVLSALITYNYDRILYC